MSRLRGAAVAAAWLLALLPGALAAQPGAQGFAYAAAFGGLVVVSTTGADEREPFADGSDPLVAPGGGRIAYWSGGSLNLAPLAGDGPVVSTVTEGRPRSWRADGQVLALEHPTGMVELASEIPGQAVGPFPGSAPRFAPVGGALLLLRDGAVMLRDAEGGELPLALGGPVEAAEWTGLADAVIARLADGGIVRYHLDSASATRIAEGPGAHVLPSPDGFVLALLDDLRLRFLNGVTGEPLREQSGEFPFEAYEGSSLSGVWLPDARQLEVQYWFPDDSGCHCAATFASSFVPEAGAQPVGTIGSFGGQAGSPPPQVIFFPPAPGQVQRHEGPTRFETAAAVSAATFAQARTVVLAPYDRYAEALIGAAATLGEGPLLLTTPDGLHPAAAAEIARLEPAEVLVIGNEDAVGDAVLDDVRALGVEPTRVGSADGTPFGVAVALAQRLPPDQAFLVEGANADPLRGWPDALAVSAFAAMQQAPVLLTLRDELPAVTREQLATAGYDIVTIIGGTASVSEAVADEVRALAGSVERIAGASRWETSEAVAALHVARGAQEDGVVVATGDNWPDAVAAGPAAVALNHPLVLSYGRTPGLAVGTRAWLDRPADIATVTLVGGADVLSPAVGAGFALS